MIEYSIEDVDGNTLALNDDAVINPTKGSLTLKETEFNFENRIVENSSLPGAVQLGKRRLESRSETVLFKRANSSDSEYRDAENELMQFLMNAKYLNDVTNNRRVRIATERYSISPEDGSYNKFSKNEIEFRFLDPFWTSTVVNQVTDTLAADINEIELQNDGYLTTPPTIVFTASVAVSKIQIYIEDTLVGMQIDDALFGNTGYGTLEIDCDNGTIYIGTLNRINSILTGTGFFDVPLDTSNLIIIPSAACDVVISWYDRYYM